MKVTSIIALAWVFVSCSEPVKQSTQQVEQAQQKSIFPWLLGNWIIDYGDTKVYESWKQQDETMLIGEGFVVAGKDTVVREDLRIQRIGNKWVFIACINENSPVLFTCKQDSAGVKLVFENAEHDFPQRITYGQKNAAEMYAIVYGKEKGQEKQEDYLYKRF